MESDFDFLHGTWRVHNRRLRHRLVGSDDWEEFTATSTVTPLFDGAANVDEIDFGPGQPRGLTLRLFDPSDKQWRLHWTVSSSGQLFPPVVGAFSDGVGTFYGDDEEGGVPVRVRFVWSGISATTARWEQSFSTDGGLTWEKNWVMEMTRQ